MLGRAPLAVVFLAMAVGIVGDRLIPLPGHSAGVLFLVAAAWLVAYAGRLNNCSAGLLFVLVAFSSAHWHHAWMGVFAQNDLAHFATPQGVLCIVDARLVETPRVFSDDPDPLSSMPRMPISRCRLQACRLRDGAKWKPVRGHGQLLVKGALAGFQAGDRVSICGRLEQPMAARNPGELSRKEFAHYRREMFRLRVPLPQGVTLIQAASPWNPRYWLARFRSATERRLRALLPEPVGDLSVALLLGAQECVEQESKDAFMATGTMHLLSISGLHVMILASSLLSLMMVLGVNDRTRVLSVVGIILVYAVFTGGRAPVVRAGVAVALWGFESLLHRNRSAWNSLCAAGILVLILNPTHLFQVGAQLSFLAMMVIIVMLPRLQGPEPVEDPLDRLIRRSRTWIWQWSVATWRSVGKTFQLSALIWLVSLPLVAAWFHVISIVAAAMNLIMWIPVWVAMVSGFAVLILIWVIPPFAIPIAWVHGICLQALTWAGAWGERISASHVWVSGPGPVGLMYFYALVIMGSLLFTSRRLSLAAFSAAWLGLAVLWPLEHHTKRGGDDRNQLVAWFLSVGHGTCVVLEQPSGVLVYDAGCLGNERFAADQISRFLWARGIRRIDTLVVSHADVDHFCAVPRLIHRFPVGRICVSSSAWLRDSASVEILRTAVASAQIPIHKIAKGDVLWSQDADRIEALHPCDDVSYSNDNASSIVLAVHFGSDSLLLPGDLERDGMEALTRAPPLDVDVALAPHHGSIHSAPTVFAQWCSPQAVIISGGDATEGAARELYQALGISAWHTATDGAIRVNLDRTPGVSLQAWCTDQDAMVSP